LNRKRLGQGAEHCERNSQHSDVFSKVAYRFGWPHHTVGPQKKKRVYVSACAYMPEENSRTV
jgi:hypothetical protein